MAGFDPSLEDIGMDLNAGVDVSSGAAEAGSGGGPMANRFGPTVARTANYDNPISQRFAGVQADPMDDWASEDDLGFDLDKFEKELDADVEAELNAQAMKEATAGLNKGHWGSGWLPDIIENFKTLVDKEFERSKQKTVDHLTNQGMTKKEAQKAVADDEGIVAKISGSIDDLIQTINPFKTDWAQENLYGTPSKYKENAVNEYYVTPSGNVVPDTINNPYVSQSYSDYGMAGQDKIGSRELSRALKEVAGLEKEVADLSNKVSTASKYGAMSELGLTGHRFAEGNPVGYGSQAFMDAFTTQQGVEDQLTDGGIAAVDSFTNMPSVSPATIEQAAMGMTAPLGQGAMQSPFAGYPSQQGIYGQPADSPLGKVVGMFEDTDKGLKDAVALQRQLQSQGMAASMTSPMQETGGQFAVRVSTGYGGTPGTTFNVDVNQAVQDLQNQSDLSNLIALEESGPTLDELLAGQPIGSSPLAPAYNEAFNYKGADFPGNAGINAVGTQFGPQWGKTPDPLWAGETVPGPLPNAYKANMGEALKAWDSPLQSAYRPEGELPDTILGSPQDLVLEQLQQAPPAWMNQGWPDELPEYDQFFQKEDGGLAGMQEGVYGPPSMTESAQSAFGAPDSTEGLSPEQKAAIDSNPAVKESYVNARKAIIDQLLAADKLSHEDWYPGSQAAAVKAGFWGPMATKANPAYNAYKDKQRAVMGLKPGEKFMSDNWINAFGGLTPEQINALVGY